MFYKISEDFFREFSTGRSHQKSIADDHKVKNKNHKVLKIDEQVFEGPKKSLYWDCRSN